MGPKIISLILSIMRNKPTLTFKFETKSMDLYKFFNVNKSQNFTNSNSIGCIHTINNQIYLSKTFFFLMKFNDFM